MDYVFQKPLQLDNTRNIIDQILGHSSNIVPKAIAFIRSNREINLMESIRLVGWLRDNARDYIKEENEAPYSIRDTIYRKIAEYIMMCRVLNMPLLNLG